MVNSSQRDQTKEKLHRNVKRLKRGGMSAFAVYSGRSENDDGNILTPEDGPRSKRPKKRVKTAAAANSAANGNVPTTVSESHTSPAPDTGNNNGLLQGSRILKKQAKKKPKRKRTSKVFDVSQVFDVTDEVIDVSGSEAAILDDSANTVDVSGSEAAILDDATADTVLLLPCGSDGVQCEDYSHEDVVMRIPQDTLIWDSLAHSQNRFEWLIQPVSVGEFFKDIFEQRHLLIQRENRDFYDGIFSLQDLDSILRQHDVQFSINLDVTRYEDGERETLNPDGRAHAPLVWNFFNDGCSIRMLNPQTFKAQVNRLCSELQDAFGTFVGANLYLTPAGTQGFAPHFDDVEVFILQLEGGKTWRVCEPRNADETLPKFSSPNFSQDEIGEPILTTDLRPGDLLYLPRGYIHQAQSNPDCHSLHLTISTTQCNTWGDFMKKLLSKALDHALLHDVEFRRSLPRHYLNSMGVMRRHCPSEARNEFRTQVDRLCRLLHNHVNPDVTADETAKCFLETALPPVLTESEKLLTINGSSSSGRDFSPADCQPASISPESSVKFVRRNICRVCYEADPESGEMNLALWHCLNNTTVYKERALVPHYLPEDVLPAFQRLSSAYPEFVRVADLPGDEDDNVNLCEVLFDKGIVMLRPEST